GGGAATEGAGGAGPPPPRRRPPQPASHSRASPSPPRDRFAPTEPAPVRTVYLGPSDFAAAVLRRLADSPHRPQLVVTRPDRPKGRGQKVSPTPVAVAALQLGIPCIAPEQLHAPEGLQQIPEQRPAGLPTRAFRVLIND